MKAPQLLFTIALMAAAIAIVGCGVSYGDVSEPSTNGYSPVMFGDASPDKAYIPPTFVEFFNAEKGHNEFRVSDWPGTEVFRFRLPDVEVGDGTVTYSSNGFPPSARESLKVTCTFADAAESRTINNGDTVDIEGRVAEEVKRSGFRIVVDLEPCYRIEYER